MEIVRKLAINSHHRIIASIYFQSQIIFQILKLLQLLCEYIVSFVLKCQSQSNKEAIIDQELNKSYHSKMTISLRSISNAENNGSKGTKGSQ